MGSAKGPCTLGIIHGDGSRLIISHSTGAECKSRGNSVGGQVGNQFLPEPHSQDLARGRRQVTFSVDVYFR